MEHDENVAEAIDRKDVIAFWQKEVHYYEGRAGEQGASANRLVTVAAGAVAAVGVISTVAKASELNAFLVVVPLVIALMWATAVRLLHEMSILRVYRAHAEWRLSQLTSPDGLLSAYRAWDGIGSRYDAPWPITTAWTIPAVILSVGGTLWILGVVSAFLLPWAAWLAWILMVVVLVLILVTFITNETDAHKTRTDLGMPPDTPTPALAMLLRLRARLKRVLARG